MSLCVHLGLCWLFRVFSHFHPQDFHHLCNKWWLGNHSSVSMFLPRLFPLRHRAFVLASFCRFGTTARKAASGACAAGSGGPGGSAELLRSWQRCRQARAWPRQTAEAAQNLKDSADAMEWCCGDMRCMNRLLELQPTLKEGKQL